VAIGQGAGQNNQLVSAVAIGQNAANQSQGFNAVAIGNCAAQYIQSPYAIAMGQAAGQTAQGASSIAMGWNAGANTQGSVSVAIGANSAQYLQGNNSVAIGYGAGAYAQGGDAIAIGTSAGQTNQSVNSVVINASGAALNATYKGLYMNPVRMDTDSAGGTTLTPSLLMYNANTSEVFYSSVPTTVGKTFVIDHPTKPDNYLVHACLEGPEAGVYYRGEGCVVEDSVEVCLPDYVDSLATDFTVNLTPIGAPRVLGVSRVVNGKFTVYSAPGEFFWTVYGSRGAVDVEPLKDHTDVRGDGPYRWIK